MYRYTLRVVCPSLEEKEAQVRDLEEQVRDLMVYLDAQSKVAEATAEGGQLEGGSVVGVGEGAGPGPSRGANHARLQNKLEGRRKSGGG